MPKEKRLTKRAKKNKPIRQVAAIPYRITDQGTVEVLLVTSNTTRRFIVPKGWPMKNKSGRQAAKEEVEEEAGVTGAVSKKAIGTYRYWKRLSSRFVNVEVSAYLLEVTGTVPEWKESRKRGRAWLSPADASTLIDEPDLAALVLSLSEFSESAMREAMDGT